MTKRADALCTGELRDRNTIRVVADHWAVSTDTVRRLVESGKLDALRIGGVIRISREQVEAYEAENSTAMQAIREKERADTFRAQLNKKRIRETLERQRMRDARLKAGPGKV